MKKSVSWIMAFFCIFSMACFVGCGNSAQGKEDFIGLYDETKPKEESFIYTDKNMMYDFEEAASCVKNITFDSIFGNVSLNKDKQYITRGNGSMKLEVYGRADGSWSITYFQIDGKYSDFTDIVSVKMDLMYVTEDGGDQIVSFGLWASSGERCETDGTKARAKSGEWFTFEIRPHDEMYAYTIGGKWHFHGKWNEKYLKSMTRMYVSLPPFKKGQKPVTLYIDNIRVEKK